MNLVKALAATAAFATDRAGSVASYVFQSRETLAFFRQLIAAVDKAYSDAKASVTVPITPSPMTYTAPGRVSLYLFGGTVTSLVFKRGPETFPLAITSAGQMIPLNPGDQVVISYSAAPSISEISR